MKNICLICEEIKYSEGLAYKVNDDGSTCSITGIGSCTDLDIKIPEYIDGYKVTSIGKYAFEDCAIRITSIFIPNSVTSIGQGAFYSRDSLENIIVEPGNTVYHSAGNCLIETASKTLIEGCKNSVIPADGSVTSIAAQAFAYDRDLAWIIIPNSVTSIGRGAFSGCIRLTSVVIGDSVTSIDGIAFDGCDSLRSITIPDSVTDIADDAFHNTYIQTATIPTHAIGYIPKENLTHVHITSGTSIRDYAFSGYDKLYYVKISDSVTSIGDYAFKSCGNLDNIFFEGTIKQWNEISKGIMWDYGIDDYCRVYCTDGSISK